MGDTIRTGSGLQYFYLKKGDGRQIEIGSKVAAYNRLYLNDVDTVFWASEDNEDSTFTWIHGVTSLIKGANELYPLLREGDEVVAIMPDSIAYGKEDNRGLPGGSTLIFNPIIIKEVGEPKLSLGDTLKSLYDSLNLEKMITKYRSIMESEERKRYHSEAEVLAMDILGYLQKRGDTAALNAMSDAMRDYAETIADLQMIRRQEATAAYQAGEFERSMRIINEALEDEPDHVWFNQVKQSLAKQMTEDSE